ncbi:MAG TPA: glycosyltransferase [Candidatus Saccharimonadales bacterium]|jgi:glycosyltransferase involved in cell wall biosynthesis
MKKILFLSHTGAVTGGAEQCLLEYVDVLIRNGYKCTVMVPYKGPMTENLAKKNIPSIVVGYGWATKPHRKVHPHRILASTGNSLVRIFQEVEKYKPDVIISNTTVIPWGMYAGRAFGIPNIVLVHEILNEKDPSLRMVPDYKRYGQILNDNSDYIIFNSLFVKNEFDSSFASPKLAEKILYPLPPLDAEKIRQLYKKNEIKKNISIAIFGALSPRKNQLEAVQAIKILSDQGKKFITLDLYGDTEADARYTKQLRKYIRDNGISDQVKIKGFTSEAYVRMNEYNAILSTATYEPFGRTIIEGQLFGRIVVTNNTGGGLELVEDRRTGFVYTSGDHESLASTLDWIISHAEESIAMATAAKQIQLDKFFSSDRYEVLLDAVAYLQQHRAEYRNDNIFDPTLALFQHNHQLNIKYKNIHRLTHNRFTYKIKGKVIAVKTHSKKMIKKII